jgi:hypothetical protein
MNKSTKPNSSGLSSGAADGEVFANPFGGDDEWCTQLGL